MSTHQSSVSRVDQVLLPSGHVFRKLPTMALGLGLLSLGAAAYLGISAPKQFFFSYMVAFSFFLALCLGCMFFVIIQFATRAGWSVVVRRIPENFMAAAPVLILFFIPVIFGLHTLYHWTHHEAVASDPILHGKAPFLNETFFYIRAGIYFTLWTLISRFLYSRSVAQDHSGDQAFTYALQKRSYLCIFLLAISSTFAAFDWIMSLDPHWFSTIFGVYFFAGSILSAFAFITVIALLARASGLLRGVVTGEHFHDLGKLVFAFTCFWTYIAFSQYLLQWYANMPEETLWWNVRNKNGWENVSQFLALGHFVVPFLFLLPRTIKRNPVTLFLGATWMLIMQFVDLHWLIVPNMGEPFGFTALDLFTFLGVGGVFLGIGFLFMRKNHLIPIKDPRLPESLRFENI